LVGENGGGLIPLFDSAKLRRYYPNVGY